MLFRSPVRPALFFPDLASASAYLLSEFSDGQTHASRDTYAWSLPAAAHLLVESIIDRFAGRRRDVCRVTTTGDGVAAMFGGKEKPATPTGYRLKSHTLKSRVAAALDARSTWTYRCDRDAARDKARIRSRRAAA